VVEVKLKQKVERFENEVQKTPEKLELEELADKYFTWSKKAFEEIEKNPEIRKVIHAGIEEQQTAAGIEQTAELYDAATTKEVDIYINQGEIEGREPILMVEGPAQQLFEPETPVLGTLSYHLTEENNSYEHVDTQTYGKGVEGARDLIDGFENEIEERFGDKIDLPLIDFGARHYHPVQQKELARTAFENGAKGHSTPRGVEAINQMLEEQDRQEEIIEAGGTMNHAFVLPHAQNGNLDNATLEAFKTYDGFFNDGIDTAESQDYTPVPVLIDTNNTEVEDTLEVCEYMEDSYGEDFEIVVRIDTNGANHAQPISEAKRNPENKGVSPEAVSYFAEEMIKNGYRDNMTFAISSGMGKTEKLDDVLEEAKGFYEEHREPMFDAVGAGSFDGCDNLYATSDIVAVDGVPTGKKGRLEELTAHAKQRLGYDVADDKVFEAYRDQKMIEYNLGALEAV